MWLSSSASRPSSSPSGLRSPSPATTLAEALRKNPFRPAPKETSTSKSEDATTTALNRDLHILANFFPDVQIDVLRELLTRFDGDSRLPICTEQVYKYKTEWARGRIQTPPRSLDEDIPLEEQFRCKSYTDAAFKALALEYRSSTKSVIHAVLAEVNHSYTKARPVLRDLANKSRWNIITSIFGYRKKKFGDEPPTVFFDKSVNRKLVSTGCGELDQELYSLFIQPGERRNCQDQQVADLSMAQTLNQQEAEEAKALFECQVCYNDVTFEEMSTCSSNGHVTCLECVRRTLHEAIFGQGWNNSVDSCSGTLKCLAPTTSEDCDGHIPQHLLKRAVLDQKSGTETWARFENRLADDSIHKSALPLVRCPFCSYAEVDQSSSSSANNLKWQLRKPNTVNVLLFVLLAALLPSLLILIVLPLNLIIPAYTKALFHTSLIRLVLHHRPQRFHCLNPPCLRRSCLNCSKPWHDPHICHEPLLLSLRTTVEAARTNAVKRTCPRCGTSFVKASGCNKLVCVCGYAMCYLCRQNIGKAIGSEGGGGGGPGNEGYRHFCEHFRPNPGLDCTECDKCDLYKSEDEDGVVRRAGERAEREWREREGMVGVPGLEGAVQGAGVADQTSALSSYCHSLLRGEWSLQAAVDWIVERVVVVQPD